MLTNVPIASRNWAQKQPCAIEAAMQILKFESKEDAEQYGRAWNNNSGWNNRRSGGLNDVHFTKVGENIGNSNHKGKQ